MSTIKVISLKRSIDRKNIFAAVNAHLKYEFFDAVDGALLDDSILSDKAIFGPGLSYSKGAYGCALSHLACWDNAIKEDRPYTIAEDDAIFREDFEEKSQLVLSMLPKDWDFILWGWNFDSILSLNVMPNISPSVMLFNQDTLRSATSSFQKLNGQSFPLRLDQCLGIPCYSISPAGARKFKEMCFPLEVFDLYFPIINGNVLNLGIDIAMNKIYFDTNSYASFPPLVSTKNEREISTIQPSKPPL